MSVCSAHRQVLPYSSRSKAHLLDRCVMAAILHSTQHSRSRSSSRTLSYYASDPSITNKTRSPCRRVIPRQTPCLLLITIMMALSDPHKHASILLRYRLCQTKKCLRPFYKATSHRSPAFVCPLSSGAMIRLHAEEFSRRQSL